LAEAVTRTFSLGEASRLEELFREGGFSQIESGTVKHTFVLPSFDAYYGPFERGGASTGQALAALSDELRRAVRDEVRRDFGDTNRPRPALGGDAPAGSAANMAGLDGMSCHVVGQPAALCITRIFGWYVRFGSKADMAACPINVRFTPKSGHCRTTLGCPLWVKSKR
jgi:hypothetical protein